MIKSVADMAIEHELYIVINIAEKAYNERNQSIYYNTNVVFDKQGKIVAK